MVDFEKAYEKTMQAEGKYCNDPTDVGGETYKGISRVYNPKWTGWVTIDDFKKESSFPKNLDSSTNLQKSVKEFYKEKYWDINKLDNIKSQKLAEEMFDTGVNLGVGRAAKFLQEGLNYLNRNETLYKDLVVDLDVGNASLSALDIVLKQNDEEVLLKIVNVLQGMHYLEYMKKSPTQEKFARGWFRTRISL